jgi:hypothetical protein
MKAKNSLKSCKIPCSQGYGSRYKLLLKKLNKRNRLLCYDLFLFFDIKLYQRSFLNPDPDPSLDQSKSTSTS